MRTLQAAIQGTTPTAFSRINGTLFQVGGPLDRESGVTQFGRTGQCNLINQVDDHLLFQFQRRTYKFFPDAVHTTINTLAGTFLGPSDALPNGELVTGQTSFNTARVIEDTIGGDTFIKLVPVSGVLQAGEQILGGTSGATCNLDNIPAARGDSNFEGEWGVRFTTSLALGNVNGDFSGWHPVLIDSKTKFISLYYSTGPSQLNAIEFDPDNATYSLQFTENLAVFGSWTAAFASDRFGHSQVIRETLYLWTTEQFQEVSLVAYNARTKTAGILNGTGAGSATKSANLVINVIPYRGKILVGMISDNATAAIQLREVAGGGINTVLLSFATGGAGDQYNMRPRGTIQNDQAGQLLLLDDALFIMLLVRTANNANVGYTLAKVTEKGGVYTADNFISDGVTIEDSLQSLHMGVFALPAFLEQSQIGGSLQADQALYPYLEQETNQPDGQDILELLYSANRNASAAMDALDWIPFTSLADVTYTFDGTTTVVTSAQSTKNVGDWIGLISDEQMFRISAVNPGNVVIENPAGRTIPIGVGPMRELQAMNALGTIAGVSEHVATSDYLGGGHRTYINDEPNIRISSRTAISGGLRLGLKAFKPGGGTGFASLYFGDDGDEPCSQQATIIDPSVGAIGGNENDTFPLDGTEQFFTWDTDTDGVLSGEIRRYVPRIRQ